MKGEGPSKKKKKLSKTLFDVPWKVSHWVAENGNALLTIIS